MATHTASSAAATMTAAATVPLEVILLWRDLRASLFTTAGSRMMVALLTGEADAALAWVDVSGVLVWVMLWASSRLSRSSSLQAIVSGAHLPQTGFASGTGT